MHMYSATPNSYIHADGVQAPLALTAILRQAANASDPAAVLDLHAAEFQSPTPDGEVFALARRIAEHYERMLSLMQNDIACLTDTPLPQENPQQAEKRIAKAEARAKQAERQLSRFKESMSWRVTAPLRKVRTVLRG